MTPPSMPTEARPSRGANFPELLQAVQYRLVEALEDGHPVFRTSAGDLFKEFLSVLPLDVRGEYNCNECRRFVNTFGGLVTVNKHGGLVPILLPRNAVGYPFDVALDLVYRIVCGSKITGVFYSDAKRWGTQTSGGWSHLWVKPPHWLVYENLLKTPQQASAERAEDFRLLVGALEKYSTTSLVSAVGVLRSEALTRAEKALPQAEWLLALATELKNRNVVSRQNLTWVAAATAPAGWCHVSSTVLGTLLDGIMAGLPVQDIVRSWNLKLAPNVYQRPQAPPTAGNIDRAEEIIKKLGAEGSLKRRFARLDDIKVKIFDPSRIEPSSRNGVFAHLREAREQAGHFQMPSRTLTWRKFAETILPRAEAIDLVVPAWGNFCAMVTAAHRTSPPILQWDFDHERNPVSWYVIVNGSSAARWGLNPMRRCPVTAITPIPSLWGETKVRTMGDGVIVILKGARDTEHQQGGGLFPEILRSEYHEIRSTIEAHTRRTKILDSGADPACGIKIQAGPQAINAEFWVTSRGSLAHVRIDRWD